MLTRRAFVAAALLLPSGTPSSAVDGPVRVGAAASLKGALDEVAQEFRRTTGTVVAVTYAASSALARQIEAGAPFHLFISADVGWMDYLDGRGRIDGATRRNVLGNALVLIGPSQANSMTSLRIEPRFALLAALQGGKLAMANPDAVPAGRYGKAALEALGVWASVASSVARAENVRAALTLVARGEAPLGIVYRTDAQAEPAVRIVDTFPARLHPSIVYPAALVRDNNVPKAAHEFLLFLGSRPAEAIWRRHGFAAPE